MDPTSAPVNPAELYELLGIVGGVIVSGLLGFVVVRRARAARITLIRRTGEREEIDLEPLICFRMKGIGYSHPEWGHGMWKGELAYAGESWKVADLDPMAYENQHLQQVVRATCGDQVGIGVLEQIAFGPHARYGFKELLDPA